MDQELVIPVVIITALAALLVLISTAFILRRHTLSRRTATFECSLRQPDGHWSLGIARYGVTAMEWYRVFSFAWRPMRTWERDGLAILERRETDSDEFGTSVPQPLIVRCRYKGDDVDLAMTFEAYTGFASWLESSPPGPYARVT